jgi:hypothetical protein
MTTSWKYQIRIYLERQSAEIARHNLADPSFGFLRAVLDKHEASLKCQLDAFLDYIEQSERQGRGSEPLCRWTRDTVNDPGKRLKHAQTFVLYIRGEEVYTKELADALEADLMPLVDGSRIKRLSKHDTNPHNNSQVPERYRRQ